MSNDQVVISFIVTKFGMYLFLFYFFLSYKWINSISVLMLLYFILSIRF